MQEPHSSTGADSLNSGMAQLKETGEGQLSTGASNQKAAGTQVRESLTAVSSLVAGLGDLSSMTDSVNQLAEGAKQISEGNEKLQAGYKQLQDTKAAETLTSGADQLLNSEKTITDGINTLQGKDNANATALLNGAITLKSAKESLDAGISSISKATGKLVTGVGQIAANSVALLRIWSAPLVSVSAALVSCNCL